MVPDEDSQVGPPECHSHSGQRQTVTNKRADSKMVATQLDHATSSPQGRIEQRPKQTAKRVQTFASLQHDGQLRSPDNVPEDHGTIGSTDAQGVSRSLFGVPPSRSQLDAFFRQEKQQSEYDFQERWNFDVSKEQERWNFDVSKEQPTAGRWKYDCV